MPDAPALALPFEVSSSILLYYEQDQLKKNNPERCTLNL
jgi:hypothetical protein